MRKILSEQGIEALKKVKEHIIEEPKRLVMDSWMEKQFNKLTRVKDSYSPLCQIYEFGPCGTAACIAGWTKIIFSNEENEDHACEFAKKYLFIDNENYLFGGDLFYVDRWDTKYRIMYGDSKTPEEKAKVAAAYIDHYIETRGNAENSAEGETVNG